MLTEAEITTRLALKYNPDLPPYAPFPEEILTGSQQHAAVLIPLLNVESDWRLLFIRRTENRNDRHSGQVSFPGGRCQSGDPEAETAALREAHEEIGVPPDQVRILGHLNDMMTVTNYRVTPIVGVIPWPTELIPQPEEVSRIFTIPLAWLADPRNREIRTREFNYRGLPIPVIYFKPFDGELLWGATARMVLAFLKVVQLDRI
jgi:8-oxo-dGTP pyrophosphatase MutT (NUDIX family)